MGRSGWLTIVLIALTTILSIYVLNRALEGSRWDWTEDSLYSLTDGTRQILERMGAEGVRPVEIKLYFSDTAGKTLPRFIKDFVNYERYVRSLLREYERAAQGRIRLDFIDPLPDSDEQQDALDYGLDGKPINQQGDLFFFGLVFQTQTGSTDSIEFLWPEQQETTEYEITKRLQSLLWPSGQKIGVLSSLEVFGGADNPYMAQMMAAQGRSPAEKWIALELLQESYDVRKIPVDTGPISSDDYDLVVVIHPKELAEETLFALDDWIARGGKALIFVDPYAIDDQPPQNPQQPWMALEYRPSSGLARLLSGWGLEMPENRFAVDLELAARRSTGAGGGPESLLYDLVFDDAIRESTMASDHPMLAGISELRSILAGGLEITPMDGIEATPLLTTTASGTLLEVEPGFGGGAGLAYADLNNPAKIRDGYLPGSEPVVIGVQVSGRLGPVFAEGIESGDASLAPVPEEERGESTVLVFTDVDLLSDQIAFQRNFLGLVLAANDNHKLLLNAVDYLLGSQELMSVRAKRRIERPFLLFEEIEAAAEKETLDRERQLRADIEAAETELQARQRELSGSNAALFQKTVRDEVDRLNDTVREANRELRQIRDSRRRAIEREEARVRRSVLGWMPALVLVIGLTLAVRRSLRRRDQQED